MRYRVSDKENALMTAQIEGFDAIEREVDAAGRSLVFTNWEKVALNALTIPLLGMPVDVSDSSRQDETAIGDEWLGAVAGLPTVSSKGLRYLSDALAAKGWVSVREATRFIEIEKAAAAKVRAVEEAHEQRSNVGAAILLARADRDLPGTISRVAEGAKDLADAAAAMAVFTKEVALVTGRGVGAAAGWLRNLRT